jgi:hypothetical protein
MGGSSFVIYGNAKEECLRPRVKPRTIWDRLLGRKHMAATPEWNAMGKDSHSIDLPVGNLSGIGTEFRDYIIKRFPKPWAATKSVIQYLGKDQPHIYIRGEKTGNKPPEWYVQLAFSDCAGEALISSYIAFHWAERWYRDNQADIMTRYFQPYGFEPNGRDNSIASSELFVPFGDAGYAIYEPTAEPKEEEYPESRYFGFDSWFEEGMEEDQVRKFYDKIDNELRQVLPSDSCCCQWCNPNFDTAVCDKLVPFR